MRKKEGAKVYFFSFDSKFFSQVAAMEINGTDRNFEEIGHLLIGFSLADKIGDLDFPGSQAVIL